MIADKPITLLCTYPLSLSKAGDLIDVGPITSQSQSGKETGKSSKDGEAQAPLAPQRKRAEALDASDRILSLSPRERQVLDGVAQGHSNKMIARELGISVRTVEAHRTRLLERLKVHTTVEAVRLATLSRLILPS